MKSKPFIRLTYFNATINHVVMLSTEIPGFQERKIRNFPTKNCPVAISLLCWFVYFFVLSWIFSMVGLSLFLAVVSVIVRKDVQISDIGQFEESKNKIIDWVGRMKNITIYMYTFGWIKWKNRVFVRLWNIHLTSVSLVFLYRLHAQRSNFTFIPLLLLNHSKCLQLMQLEKKDEKKEEEEKQSHWNWKLYE